jgi:hypothetical protein
MAIYLSASVPLAHRWKFSRKDSTKRRQVMISITINTLRASKAVLDLIFSDKPENRRQREELVHEWECMKEQARQGIREFNDLRTGRKVLPPEEPMIRKPFQIALWILLAVTLLAMLWGGNRPGLGKPGSEAPQISSWRDSPTFLHAWIETYNKSLTHHPVNTSRARHSGPRSVTSCD